MRIIVLGGFLGSGKTTVLRAMLEAAQKLELGTVAVIENEIGEIGIDDVLIREENVAVRAIYGGCVCCELTGDLQQAVLEIGKKLKPSWLLVETTGAATLAGTLSALEPLNAGPVFCISVVDAGRWSVLSGALSYFVRSQLVGADVVIANKMDTPGLPENLMDDIRSFSKAPQVVPMEAQGKESACAALLAGLVAQEREGSPWIEMDAAAQALKTGSFSQKFSFGSDMSIECLAEKLRPVLEHMACRLAREGTLFGHLKGLLRQGERSIRFSLAGQGFADMLVMKEAGKAGDNLEFLLSVNMIGLSEADIEKAVGPDLEDLSRFGGVRCQREHHHRHGDHCGHGHHH